MLGQHPQLYGFPELNLFLTDTVGELRRLGKSPPPFGPSYLTGLLRSVAELELGGQTEETLRQAEIWVASRSRWTTQRMLACLLDRVQPSTGVEKSPRTSLSQRSIDRALAGFPQSKILHLTRHPVGTLRSLLEAHRNSQAVDLSAVKTSELANLYTRIWIRSQELILVEVEGRPLQALRIRAEELLGEADLHLERIAKWLNIASDAQALQAMKLPERSLYAWPAPLGLGGDGDSDFQRSPRLRSVVAPDRRIPREWNLEPALITKMSELSIRLGYGELV